MRQHTDNVLFHIERGIREDGVHYLVPQNHALKLGGHAGPQPDNPVTVRYLAVEILMH
jgi:hypothetical protein